VALPAFTCRTLAMQQLMDISCPPVQQRRVVAAWDGQTDRGTDA